MLTKLSLDRYHLRQFLSTVWKHAYQEESSMISLFEVIFRLDSCSSSGWLSIIFLTSIDSIIWLKLLIFRSFEKRTLFSHSTIRIDLFETYWSRQSSLFNYKFNLSIINFLFWFFLLNLDYIMNKVWILMNYLKVGTMFGKEMPAL